MDSQSTGQLVASPVSGNPAFTQRKNFYVQEVENGYTVSCRETKGYGEKISIATTIEEALKIINDYLQA